MKGSLPVSLVLSMTLLISRGIPEETGWPQFLGPNRDGSIRHEGFVSGWLRDGIEARWRTPVGEGYSGISAASGRIFTMDSNGRDEFVLCLREADGKEIWRVKTGPSPKDVYGGYGPRVTPAVDSDLLITVSAGGDLIALRSDTGAQVWKRELAREMGWRPPAEGTSCSPLIADGRVYLIIGGAGGRAVAAFDRKSGLTLWSSQEDRTSYSSPVRWDFRGVPQTLFLTGANLFSVHAANGKLLWKYPWPTYDFVNVATPVVVAPDRVFISAGYDQGAALLQVSPAREGSLEVREVWRNREMKNHFNNSVYFDGAFFGFDNAVLKAVAADTGQTLWREKGFGKGSLILAGSYLIVLGERGELACSKASRSGFSVLESLSPLTGLCWTPPSLAQDRLYLRNQKEVVCLAVRSKSSG